MKPLITVTCACITLALLGCGSSAEEEPAATATPAPTEASASAQDDAASQVCSARDDIQAQVETLTSLSVETASKGDVTSALNAIRTDLQKIKDAQADLAPERRQEVQDATAAFESQLEDIVKDAVAGLVTSDAKTAAAEASTSLKSAVRESLQPIDC